jgi:PfaD family protein
VTTITQGWYLLGDAAPRPGQQALLDALEALDQPFAVVSTERGPAVATAGQAILGDGSPPVGALPLLAWVPALTPDRLGDPTFGHTYGTRIPYVVGAMANGVASVETVVAAARAGGIGFFGSAGLSTRRIVEAIDRLQVEAAGLPWGSNLIHSPHLPQQEQQTVELYLQRGVTVVSTSAYMKLTPSVVQYRYTGVREVGGRVVPRNHVLAKVSRPEVARHFLAPAPEGMLRELVAAGRLTHDEARLAARLPMADDLTAEADSGGHTDNRPLPVLLPLLVRQAQEAAERTGHRVRVGAAGGIGTPDAAAAAFELGAAYVLTGTVNQACVEAGTSDRVKRMLAEAGMADVGMAPASDMFEGGVEVQVLKRGTLFAMRGHRLYELYRDHPSLQSIPAAEAERVQRTTLKKSFDEVWAECERYFAEVDPGQLRRAADDPKHQMALVFRWYLGLSSRWAIAGDAERTSDMQVWCGPCIGSFNAWTAGTFLADPAQRTVAVVAANLMAGAATVRRARILEAQGVSAPPDATRFPPRPVRSAPSAPAPRPSNGELRA